MKISISSTGAPRHHHHHKSEKESQEKAKSRSYIDIDATDPFKVPKNSHYMDQDMPNDFDKEEMKADEQTGRAIVEGEEGGMPEGGPEEQPQEEAPEPGNPAEEGQQQPQPQENEGGENNASLNQNLSSDLPPGITDKIDEIAKNQGGSPDGKPIEINENDLKNLMTNSAGGGEGESGQ